MKENRFYVYGHYTLDTNELFYIGEGIKKRINDRCNRNRHWNFKVNKHGFKSEIFYSDLTKEKAQEFEKELIEKLRDKLVNIGPGSIFESHWVLHIPKEMHPMFGKKSPNASKRMKIWNSEHTGENSPTWGKKRPDLSERNRTFKKSRSVRCIETGKIFSSLKEAISFHNLSGANIWKAIKKGHKAGGYHWEYADGKLPTVTSGATPFIQLK